MANPMIADVDEVLSDLHGLQCGAASRLSKQHQDVLNQVRNTISKLHEEVQRLSVGVPPPVVIRAGRSDQYDNVNLNGFTLASTEPPPPHKTVILGYRVDHLPEVWYGIGFRDSSGAHDQYWLGPRGLDPHYDALSAADVIIWRDFEKPFSFRDDESGRQTYIQWSDILGDVQEDAEFDADEANAAFWEVTPEPRVDLPWKSITGSSARSYVMLGVGDSHDYHPGYLVATGHPVGFGFNGTSPRDHGCPILMLDPKLIPDSFWRDGSTFPERTVRGYHASRFALGEFENGGFEIGGVMQQKTLDYAPLLVCHSGTTLDSPQHWIPAWDRGRGGHGIRRWVSFIDLWHSLPAAVRSEHRCKWRGMRRGYERVE